MSSQIVRYPPVVTTFDVEATNPSVGTTGSTAPASATEIGIVDDDGNLQGVSSTNPVPVTGTVTASNPSTGATGSAVPADATYVGMNVGGDLTGIPGTANGVKVDGSAVTQPVSGTVDAVQSGTWTVQPGNTPNTTAWLVTGAGGTFPVTGTFWQATQPVSAASLPLPTGAATSALQTSGNTTLSAISAQLPAALGQQTSADSLGVVLASDQSAIPTTSTSGATPSFSTAAISAAATVDAPSNAIGVIIQALDTNSANLRYALGTTASSTNGMQLEPGRDTGFIPVNANISLCPESGTQTYLIQWVAK